jgi:hypothetical protein
MQGSGFEEDAKITTVIASRRTSPFINLTARNILGTYEGERMNQYINATNYRGMQWSREVVMRVEAVCDCLSSSQSKIRMGCNYMIGHLLLVC